MPLPIRLFQARLDELEAALAQDRPDIATLTVADLRADLATLPVNNAIVAAAIGLALLATGNK